VDASWNKDMTGEVTVNGQNQLTVKQQFQFDYHSQEPQSWGPDLNKQILNLEAKRCNIEGLAGSS